MQNILSQNNKIDSNYIIEMFELDLSFFGVGVFRFCSGMRGINRNIIWQGNEYLFLPLKVTEIESKSDGTLSRPKIAFSNLGGIFDSMLSDYELVGQKIKRKRTLIQYLDDVNFDEGYNPYGSADPYSHFEDDIYIVHQKISSDKAIVQYELSSPLEIEGAALPARQIMSNFCQWKYRGDGCFYNGEPIATDRDILFSSMGISFDNWNINDVKEWEGDKNYSRNNVVFIQTEKSMGKDFFIAIDSSPLVGVPPSLNKKHWIQDQCSKSRHACIARFSDRINNIGIPFGGFPGTMAYQYKL
jgi:lambda family phage minor tail protein L